MLGRPRADSVLIRGERIAEVGTGLAAELEVRLSAAFVMPGFNDAHIHFARGAQELSRVDLVGARSPEELQQRIRERLPQFQPGEWITGHGWDHTLWPKPASPQTTSRVARASGPHRQGGIKAGETHGTPGQTPALRQGETCGKAGETHGTPGQAPALQDAASLWPTRRLLDEISEQHPMYFTRVDMHVALANTRALEAAGLLREARPDPPGGEIVRDRDGVPTGLLKETAMHLVRAVIPAPDGEARKAAISRALRVAAGFGITSLQDNSFWDDYLLFQELEREGRLSARITEWLDFTEPLEELEKKRRQEKKRFQVPGSKFQVPREEFRVKGSVSRLGTRNPELGTEGRLLRLGLVKGFADGSLGSGTAWMLEPYADAPETCGLPRFSAAALRDKVAALDAAGFQIGLHAIGDAAVRQCLDAFERAAARPVGRRPAARGPLPAAAGRGSVGRRHRIEHSQVVTESDMPRFAALGLIASVQPNHWLTDSRWAADRLGRERLSTAYRWASFARLGVPLALGTDFPVEPMDPRRVLFAAVTRDGPERLAMEDALRFYTAGSAFAEFAESDKGAIEPGKLADLAVLADDPRATQPDAVLKLETVMTLVGGEQVF